MSWTNDANVMETLDSWIVNQQSDFNAFMEAISEYMDETPMYAVLVLYAKFVMFYTQLRQDGTENEALQEALARLGNDELTQALTANIMGNMLNRRVGL